MTDNLHTPIAAVEGRHGVTCGEFGKALGETNGKRYAAHVE